MSAERILKRATEARLDLEQWLTSGSALDYPVYREVAGKIAALRSMEFICKEEMQKEAQREEDFDA